MGLFLNLRFWSTSVLIILIIHIYLFQENTESNICTLYGVVTGGKSCEETLNDEVKQSSKKNFCHKKYKIGNMYVY